MGLFKSKKSKQTTEVFTGRRRPIVNGSSNQPPSGTMFSYHSQRSSADLNTGRRETPETVVPGKSTPVGFVRRRALLVTGAVVVVLIVGYLLSLNNRPRIILLEDTTTAYFLQPQDVYMTTVQKSIEQSVFNRNKLTLDTSAIRASLIDNYPEIKNVSVALPFFGHQPQIYIEPYKPSFILTTTSSNAFLLDATGRALANTSQIADIEKLGVPTLQDKTGNEIKLGSRAIPSTTVSFTQTVIAALKSKGVETSSLTLLPAAYQLDVGIAGQKYYVKFNLQNDALQQAGALLATQGRLKTDKVTPAEYIDVRVADRSYYK